MVIGSVELLKLVKEINLVEDLCERELTNPEGAGLELRLGEVYMLTPEDGKRYFLGVENRKTPPTKLLARYDSSKEDSEQKFFELKPGGYYLVKTIEKVNLPEDIMTKFEPRTTLFRSGLILETSVANPGYEGELTWGIYNAGNVKFNIQLGARIALAVFYKSGENVRKYEGQWQDGRVSTNGEVEKQV